LVLAVRHYDVPAEKKYTVAREDGKGRGYCDTECVRNKYEEKVEGGKETKGIMEREKEDEK
jgi:hypothetical protein